MKKGDFNNFQISKRTTLTVEEKPMTNNELDKISKANKETVTHYNELNRKKNRIGIMLQEMNEDISNGVPYSVVMVNALTIIEQATGERLRPNQLKEAIQEREIKRLNEIAQKYQEEETEAGKRVINTHLDLAKKELDQLGGEI